jgi:hypothetical protein
MKKQKPDLPVATAGEVVADALANPNEEILEAGQMLGRLEAMGFIAAVADSVLVEIFEKSKKSKGWAHLISATGRNYSSLEEFCEERLGRSYRRLQEISANRSALGKAAFEQAEQLGLRQKDYAAIKALPAPDKELIRQAIEDAQSRDDVLGILQELAANHAREKADLSEEVERAEKARQTAENKANALEEKLDLYSERKKLTEQAAGSFKHLPETITVREEALAAQLANQVRLDELCRLLEADLQEPNREEALLRVNAAWVAANAIAADASRLIHLLQNSSFELFDELQPAFKLTAEEAQNWLDLSEMIQNVAAAQKERRAVARSNDPAKRGHGRPKKDKSLMGDPS